MTRKANEVEIYHAVFKSLFMSCYAYDICYVVGLHYCLPKSTKQAMLWRPAFDGNHLCYLPPSDYLNAITTLSKNRGPLHNLPPNSTYAQSFTKHS